MEQNFEPFEAVEEDGRTILWLHGTAIERRTVGANKIDIIYCAMRQGWDIDIRYADIEGDMDIKNAGLDMDEEDRRVVPATVAFCDVNFQRRADFSGSKFQRVGFIDAEFQKAIFSGAKFQAAFLSKTKFQKVDFGWAEFEGVAFSEVEFQESAEFNEAIFKMDPKIDESEHDNLSPDSLDSIGWAYRRSFLVGASHFFGKAGEGHWSETEYAKASESYRNAKVEYEKEGKYDEAGEMYVWEKDSTRRQLWQDSGDHRGAIRLCYVRHSDYSCGQEDDTELALVEKIGDFCAGIEAKFSSSGESGKNTRDGSCSH